MGPGKSGRLYGLQPGSSTAQEVPTRALAAAVAVMALAALAFLAWLALEPDAAGLRARAGWASDARVLATSSLEASTLEDMQLVSTSGLTARCAVRRPRASTRSAPRPTSLHAAMQRPRYPAFLIAAGYETGRRAVRFPRLREVVLMACDYPLTLPSTLEGGTLLRALPGLRRGIVDSPAVLLLALDYLAGQPDVDPSALAMVGASVGVPPATIAGALDERVRAVALLYGGGDLPLLFAHNFDLGSPTANRLGRAAVDLFTRAVEPTRYAAAISPRPTLAVNAPKDPFIPRESAVALHRALREPKEVRWLPLDHFAAFHEAELLARLTSLTAKWFRAHGVG